MQTDRQTDRQRDTYTHARLHVRAYARARARARARERERDRQTDRQRPRDRETETDRQTKGQRRMSTGKLPSLSARHHRQCPVYTIMMSHQDPSRICNTQFSHPPSCLCPASLRPATNWRQSFWGGDDQTILCPTPETWGPQTISLILLNCCDVIQQSY